MGFSYVATIMGADIMLKVKMNTANDFLLNKLYLNKYLLDIKLLLPEFATFGL